MKKHIFGRGTVNELVEQRIDFVMRSKNDVEMELLMHKNSVMMVIQQMVMDVLSIVLQNHCER